MSRVVLSAIVLGALSFPVASSASDRKARAQAFAAVQQMIGKRLAAVDDQLSHADLGKTTGLTRSVMASPGSDWGISGLGQVFSDKRSALTNIRFAGQHLAAARSEIATFKAEHKGTLWQRVRLGLAGRALTQREATLTARREALRATDDVWKSLGVLTLGVPADQRQVFEAVLMDRPADQPVIDRHISTYVQGKYGRR